MTRRPNTDVLDVTERDVASVVARLLLRRVPAAMVVGVEDDDCFRVVYVLARPADDHRVELVLRTPRDQPSIPSLAALSYPVGRFEREIRDLYGITPRGHPLPYRLVRHGHWPQGWYPMRRDADPAPRFDPDVGSFPFLEVEGDGVYEIPVGPVHAGLIEPGHFRFSVVGETILRMKARLWFVHRGIEKLFEGRQPGRRHRARRADQRRHRRRTLARLRHGRRGSRRDIQVAEQDRLRAGAAARARTAAQPRRRPRRARQRRRLRHRQRTRAAAARVPAAGQQGDDRPPAAARRSHVGGARLAALPDLDTVDSVAAEVDELAALTLANSTVRDRFTGTAILRRRRPRRTWARSGYVARASGIDVDARRDHPFIDLGDAFTVVVEQGGDVLGPVSSFGCASWRTSGRRRRATPSRLGWTESAPVHRRTRAAAAGRASDWSKAGGAPSPTGSSSTTTARSSRVKVVDPSFFNWPALPVALADTIVPDFPLANKSFNQSYAGNDL